MEHKWYSWVVIKIWTFQGLKYVEELSLFHVHHHLPRGISMFSLSYRALTKFIPNVLNHCFFVLLNLEWVTTPCYPECPISWFMAYNIETIHWQQQGPSDINRRYKFSLCLIFKKHSSFATISVWIWKYYNYMGILRLKYVSPIVIWF